MLLLALAGGCTPERRELSYRTPLDNVPGIQRGDKPPSESGPGAASAAVDPRAAPEALIRKDERGREVLVLESPRHVIVHLSRMLGDPESDALMLEQFVSEQTKRRMITDGGEPGDAIKYIRANARAINDLLTRMPFAEQSPDVSMERQGNNVYRLRLRKGPARGLTFDSVWVVLEGGKWKWLWVSGG